MAGATSPSQPCIFCQIARGSTSTPLLHADDKVVAFQDIKPSAFSKSYAKCGANFVTQRCTSIKSIQFYIYFVVGKMYLRIDDIFLHELGGEGAESYLLGWIWFSSASIEQCSPSPPPLFGSSLHT
ncbi:hypothetical protein QUC31_008709 [Theobroma cacao]